jgi:exosortase/archaeosortase family protein
VPTVTCAPPRWPAASYTLRALAWSLAALGVLRLPRIEQVAVLPITQLQGRIAAGFFGTPVVPIDVTLACSGADAIAFCVGFIVAYPARWSARVTAALGGVALIIAVNIVRIGTLGKTTSPAWFTVMHVYVWPAVLLLAVATYVFWWMRRTDAPMPAAVPVFREGTIRITRRFMVLSAAFLVLFVGASPLYSDSAVLLTVAGAIAHGAAVTLRFMGLEASVEGNVLWTGRGGFLVTQECIATPLIPLYLAAAVAYSTGPRRIVAILLVAPLFFALGMARLFVVALPIAVGGAPMVLVHGFYQWVVAAVLVGLAAAWAYGSRPAAWWRAALATALGVVCFYLVTPIYGAVIHDTRVLAAGDPQGALGQLPAFQVALSIALCIAVFAIARWRVVALGFAALAVTQLAGFAALHAIQAQMNFTPDVRAIRGWALGAPMLLLWTVVTYGRPRR